MATFHIKRGDLLPSLIADLVDHQGVAIDLSDPSITVRASVARADGTLLVNDKLADKVLDVTGRVRYQWAAGETDEPGDYYAEFVVHEGGVSQTFPTEGYTLVRILSDVNSLAARPMLALNKLRRMTGERKAMSLYTDDELLEVLNLRTINGVVQYDVAALDIWREKAAHYAGMIDTDESGSVRKYSQLYTQAVGQVKLFEERLRYVDPAVAALAGRVVGRSLPWLSDPFVPVVFASPRLNLPSANPYGEGF